MSATLVHDMGPGWVTTNPATLAVAVDPVGAEVGSASSTRMTASAAAAGEVVRLTPAAPLDLGGYDELRFWVRSTRRARGSAEAPFYLAIAYHDAADLAADVHRWLVPVGRTGRWEHVTIGIGADRRTAVDEIRFDVEAAFPFECQVDELRAVRAEMLRDAEEALARHLADALVLPQMIALPLLTPTTAGGLQAVIALADGFRAGNLIELRDPAGAETHTVQGVTNDTTTGRTTFQFAAGDGVTRVFSTATGRLSLQVPVLVENPPSVLASTTPALQVALMDAREDLERTAYRGVPDSFRRRGALTVCSVRRSARAYVADYMLTVVAPERMQALTIHEAVLQRISMDQPLPIHGVGAPLWILPPPALERDDTDVPTRIHLRIGLHMPVGPRVEQPWVQRAVAVGAQLGAPDDQEGIVLQL